MKPRTENPKKQVRIVTIQGNTKTVLDVWLDGKLKRFYERASEDMNDIKISTERLISKAQLAFDSKKMTFLANVPKQGTLEDYVRYYIKGIAEFDCDVLDVTNIMEDNGTSSVRILLRNNYATYCREKALQQCDYLIAHTICRSRINKNITALTSDDFNNFFEIITGYFSDELISELYLILQKTFSMTNRLGITRLDFSSVKKMTGVDAKCTNKKIYFLNKQELALLKQCCVEESLPRIFLPQYLHLLTLSFFTGHDCKEFLGMRGIDIDYERRQINLNGVPIRLSRACISWLKTIELRENVRFESMFGPVFDLAQDRQSFNYYRKVKDTIAKIYFYLALPVSNHSEVMLSYVMMKVFEDKVPLESLKADYFIYQPTFNRNAEKYKEFKEARKEW